MSDRLAVMNNGIIEQIGAPRDVYDHPVNTYVADFLGLANLVPAMAEADAVTLLGQRVAASTGAVRGACTVIVRPERVTLVPPQDAAVRARIDTVVFAGALTHVHLTVDGQSLQAMVANDGAGVPLVEGGEVGVALAADALRVLPA